MGCADSRERTHSNWGVLTAGIWTVVTWTLLPRCSSSVRSEEVKPLMACLAPQYADCSGMDRSPSAEPTCTIVPRSRGSMRLRAERVPLTKPR